MERSDLSRPKQDNCFDFPLARVKVKSEYPQDRNFLTNVNSAATLDKLLQIPANKIVIAPKVPKSEPEVSFPESKPLIHTIEDACPQNLDILNLRNISRDESREGQKLLESCSEKKVKIVLQRVDENIMREFQRRKKVKGAILFARKQKWIRDVPSSDDSSKSVVSVKSDLKNVFKRKNGMIEGNRGNKGLIRHSVSKSHSKSCWTKADEDEDEWPFKSAVSKKLVVRRKNDDDNCVYENTKTVLSKTKNQKELSVKIKNRRGQSFGNIASISYSSSSEDEKPFSKNHSISSIIQESQANKNIFACSLCPVKSAYKGNLERHVKNFHKDVKRIKRTNYSSRFAQYPFLKIPTNMHSKKKYYNCVQCSSKFSHVSQLKIHLKKHSDNIKHVDLEHHACVDSPLRPDCESHLNLNIKINFGAKPLHCAHCPAKYSHSGHLRKHIMKHFEEKPYACSVCPLRYKYKSQLKHHLNNHIGDKPLQCTHCPARYSHSGHFRNHIMNHVVQKHYSCTKCPSKFRLKSDFLNHLKLHSKVKKAFSCSLCPKSYTLKNNVRRHFKKEHISRG